MVGLVVGGGGGVVGLVVGGGGMLMVVLMTGLLSIKHNLFPSPTKFRFPHIKLIEIMKIWLIL